MQSYKLTNAELVPVLALLIYTWGEIDKISDQEKSTPFTTDCWCTSQKYVCLFLLLRVSEENACDSTAGLHNFQMLYFAFHLFARYGCHQPPRKDIRILIFICFCVYPGKMPVIPQGGYTSFGCLFCFHLFTRCGRHQLQEKILFFLFLLFFACTRGKCLWFHGGATQFSDVVFCFCSLRKVL